MLQLTSPLAIIDLETTGINLGSDRIVEIAIVKILPDGKKQIKRKLINPEIPIPASSSEIHGITNEMIKDAPTFRQVANELKQFLDHCDLAGWNSKGKGESSSMCRRSLALSLCWPKSSFVSGWNSKGKGESSSMCRRS